MKWITILAAVIATLGAGGCATPAPLTPGQMRQPELKAIHESFALAVEAAHTDPELVWHSGWFGNVLVNLPADDDRGLCHQWQKWVYRRVAPTAAAQNWEVCGIAINMGSSAEHHAVLVFDPRKVALESLPYGSGDGAAYVLDAWRRGKPDVFFLADWLEIPLEVRAQAVLEDLSASDDPPLTKKE